MDKPIPTGKRPLRFRVKRYIRRNHSVNFVFFSVLGLLVSWFLWHKIDIIERNAEHKVLDQFALVIGGAEQSNITLEKEVIARRTQVQALLMHAKQQNWTFPADLAILPEMPKYESVEGNRANAQKKMIEVEQQITEGH